MFVGTHPLCATPVVCAAAATALVALAVKTVPHLS